MKDDQIHRLRKKAESGDAQAQYKLAYLLSSRRDARKYRKEALELLKAAAEQGNSDAQYALGNWFSRGIVVQKNFKVAFAYLQIAAKQGNPLAQFELADALARGKEPRRIHGRRLNGTERQPIKATLSTTL